MCEGYFLQFGDPVDFRALGDVDAIIDDLKWVAKDDDY